MGRKGFVTLGETINWEGTVAALKTGKSTEHTIYWKVTFIYRDPEIEDQSCKFSFTVETDDTHAKAAEKMVTAWPQGCPFQAQHVLGENSSQVHIGANAPEELAKVADIIHTTSAVRGPEQVPAKSKTHVVPGLYAWRQ